MARPKKTIRFSVQEFSNPSGTLSYRVTGRKPDGGRVRQNFPTRLEAEQQRVDLEAAAGLPASTLLRRTRLQDDQLADAEAAINTSGDRKLADLAAHYHSIEERLRARGVTIDAAVSFAETHYRPNLVGASILNAQAEFLRSRAEMEPRTRSFYKSSLRLLLLPDPNKPLPGFTVADLEEILGRYRNVNSRRAHRTAFSVFFNWCVRHHYCLEDRCKRLDKLPRDMSRIAVLSLEEVERLLCAAMRLQEGAAAAAVAIGLFAGLRPSEIADLKAEDITGRGIRVSGGKLRRVLKRTVPVPAVLAAWLAEYPFAGPPGGWAYKLKALRKETGAKTWVQDIIRHTSITFQTERDRNEALTAFNCGTSIQMMNRHYRNTIDDDEAVAEFWSLTPERLRARNPEAVQPAPGRVAWPDAGTLARLVWEKPLVHAAAGLGVSDVALGKRCVRLGIALPPRSLREVLSGRPEAQPQGRRMRAWPEHRAAHRRGARGGRSATSAAGGGEACSASICPPLRPPNSGSSPEIPSTPTPPRP